MWPVVVFPSVLLFCKAFPLFTFYPRILKLDFPYPAIIYAFKRLVVRGNPHKGVFLPLLTPAMVLLV